MNLRLEFIFSICMLKYVLCSGQNQNSNVTFFCENGTETSDLQIRCTMNNVIGLNDLNVRNTKCTTERNRIACLESVRRHFLNKCSTKRKCTLTKNIANLNGCQQEPKMVIVKYKCEIPENLKTYFGDTFDYFDDIQACSSLFTNIQCIYFWTINITNVILERDEICDDSDHINCQKNIYDSLRDKCNGKRKCSTTIEKPPCLLHKRFVKIEYLCKGQGTTDPVSTGQQGQVTAFPPNLFKTTTASSSDLSLTLDNEGRVLVSVIKESARKTFVLCNYRWDDIDAVVICRYLTSSSIGVAINVTRNNSNEMLPFAVHCIGNETTPFQCEYDDMDSCETKYVAGVRCCKGNVTNDHDDCLNTPERSEISTTIAVGTSLGTAIAVGTSLGTIGIVCIAVLTICFVRRSQRCKSKTPSIPTKTDNNYLGHQSIALPENNETSHQITGPLYKDTTDTALSNHQYFTLDPKNTGFNRTQDTTEFYQVAKPIQQETESAYKLPEEGFYDKTNEARHVVGDLNVYSHSVDDTYDSSEHEKKPERMDCNYDHFFAPKTDDDYDLTTRT